MWVKAGGSTGVSWGKGKLFRQLDTGILTRPHSGILTRISVTSTAHRETAFISVLSRGFISSASWDTTKIAPGTSHCSFGGLLTLLLHFFEGSSGRPRILGEWALEVYQQERVEGPKSRVKWVLSPTRT